MRSLITCLLALAFTPAAMAQAQPVEVGGATFEGDAIVVGHRLPLNGAGLHLKGSNKLYAAGLYVSKRGRSYEDVSLAPGPKRLQLKILSDIEGRELGGTLSTAMNTALSASEMSACMSGLLTLGEVFSAKKKLKAGETLTLDSVPGQGTLVRIGTERVAKVDSPAFFGCVAQVYLGNKPLDSGLKSAMLGRMAPATTTSAVVANALSPAPR